MTLTVRAGLDALHAARPADPDALALAVIRGSVRGARGNSGVIVSQVLRAVVEVVTGHPRVDARLYAEALGHARELAYEAVAEPVEGTILTAIAAAADAARVAVERGSDLVTTSAASCAATAEAVERTREQLDVLRDAGVVDAGARGFEILLAAVHGHLTGENPPVREDAPRPITDREAEVCHASRAFPFEVQYLLDAADEVARPLRRRLERLGDSVVVVAAGGLLNVHVHTAEIGPSIEAGLEHGRPSSIEVVSLAERIAATDAGRARAHASTTASSPSATAPAGQAPASRPRLGAVAVLDGTGAHRLVQATGTLIVPGSAGALPSVSELVDGIEQLDAGRTLLLPGHRNAVTTARKAAELASDHARDVEVVEEAATVPAVLAALAVFDPEADPRAVAEDVRAAASGVRAGEVVSAVRDASTPAGDVRRGQPLAVAGGEVVHVGTDDLDALRAVGDALDVAHAELVTLLFGADVDAGDREAAGALVAGLGGAEVETLDAGCRRSRYWLGVE